MPFATPAEAKAWLIQQILAAAEQTGTHLDPLEIGMLAYSETERTPPDLEAFTQAFDEAFDTAEYESKIAALIRIRLAQWRAQGSPELTRWHEAVSALSQQDHYLSVLVAAAGARRSQAEAKPAHRSLTRLFFIAVLATVLITLLLGYLATHLR